jgi:hypothetical protein
VTSYCTSGRHSAGAKAQRREGEREEEVWERVRVEDRTQFLGRHRNGRERERETWQKEEKGRKKEEERQCGVIKYT